LGRNIRSGKTPFEFTISKEHHQCYNLLSKTLRDHGTPFHNENFFILLKKYFPDDVYFALVSLQEQTVAAGIIIKYKDTIITPYIGSLKQYRNQGTNYYQYWEIIKFCNENKIRHFELGRSPKGSSHEKFKEKWGAQKLQAYYNYYLINRKFTYKTVSQPSYLFVSAVQVWKKLPVGITKWLGHRFFRYIP